MRPRLERASTVIRALVHELRAENVTFMAGSIAYHAFLSMLPLLLLALAIISIVGDRTLQSAFIAFVGAVLAPGTGNALIRELRAADVSTGVSLLGAVVLLWGALRIFRGLDTAFSDIYETGARNSVADQFADGITVLLSLGLAIAVAWILSTLVPNAGSSPLVWAGYRLALVVVLAVALFPMYYVFPDADVTIREVLPGVLAAAAGLMVFESLFRLYIGFRSPGGGTVIAGVIVLLTWLYLSALVLLLGAVLNAVLSNRSRDVDIDPVVGGIDTDREDLTATVREIETALHGTEEVIIVSGDTEARLPPPRHVHVDVEGAALAREERTIGLELRWAPRESTET
jgi:membrane protein